MYGGFGSASPPLTNNPFIDSVAHPSQRFPDISNPPDQQQQYSSWGNGFMISGGENGYPQQQQGMNLQQQYPQLQQVQTGMGYGQPQQQSGYQSYPSSAATGPSQVPFQPSSNFGQQLAAHISGSSYGYLQGQQQQNSTAYNPAQQQLQNNPGYIAQFDPYSSISQGWGGNGSSGSTPGGIGVTQSFSTGSNTSTTSSTSSTNVSSYGASSSGDPHPRDYIRTHKIEIEGWDQYAWKQLLSAFESLMRAWETRKGELSRRVGELSQQMAYGGYYVTQIQQEGGRLQGVGTRSFLICSFSSLACLCCFGSIQYLIRSMLNYSFFFQLLKEAENNFGASSNFFLCFSVNR